MKDADNHLVCHLASFVGHLVSLGAALLCGMLVAVAQNGLLVDLVQRLNALGHPETSLALKSALVLGQVDATQAADARLAEDSLAHLGRVAAHRHVVCAGNLVGLHDGSARPTKLLKDALLQWGELAPQTLAAVAHRFPSLVSPRSRAPLGLRAQDAPHGFAIQSAYQDAGVVVLTVFVVVAPLLHDVVNLCHGLAQRKVGDLEQLLLGWAVVVQAPLHVLGLIDVFQLVHRLQIVGAHGHGIGRLDLCRPSRVDCGHPCRIVGRPLAGVCNQVTLLCVIDLPRRSPTLAHGVARPGGLWCRHLGGGGLGLLGLHQAMEQVRGLDGARLR